MSCLFQDVSDSEVTAALATPERSPPHIVCVKCNDIIKGTYVVGDNVVMDCKSNDFAVALLQLLAAYYVLDLDYPRIFSQVLGIFQTYFVKTVPYDGLKSKKYLFSSQKLKMALKQ